MKGMENMLKMFGFDIDELKGQIGPKIEEMQAMALRFEQKLNTAIEQNNAIIANQQQMYKLMVAGKLIPTVEAYQQLEQIEDKRHVNGAN